MLVLSRRQNESVVVNEDIIVSVIEIRPDNVRLGFDIPQHCSLHRKEIFDVIRQASPTPPTSADDPNNSTKGIAHLADSGAPVQLRDATLDDLSYINEIYNHYVVTSTCTYQEEPSTLADRRKWFAAHSQSHPVIVAEVDNTVIGFASLSPFHQRSAYRHSVENSVYVHSAFHRHGIGRMLMEELITRAKALKHHAIVALIDSEQTRSLELHRKLGFTHVGELKQVGRKFNRWLNVTYMQLMLPE